MLSWLMTMQQHPSSEGKTFTDSKKIIKVNRAQTAEKVLF